MIAAVTLLALFFFQAEDGIRDYKVTGVQTCALPICPGLRRVRGAHGCAVLRHAVGAGRSDPLRAACGGHVRLGPAAAAAAACGRFPGPGPCAVHGSGGAGRALCAGQGLLPGRCGRQGRPVHAPVVCGAHRAPDHRGRGTPGPGLGPGRVLKDIGKSVHAMTKAARGRPLSCWANRAWRKACPVAAGNYMPMPPMPPMPPMSGMAGPPSALGDSAIMASVVSSSDATEAAFCRAVRVTLVGRSEEHTSELQSPCNLVCRLLLEKKKIT